MCKNRKQTRDEGRQPPPIPQRVPAGGDLIDVDDGQADTTMVAEAESNPADLELADRIAKLACTGSALMESPDLECYFTFLKEQLKYYRKTECMQATARCLQMMLKIDRYRTAFVEQEGVQALIAALNGKVNFQMQYQLIFCLWCLTFNTDIARRLPSLGIIRPLGEILTETQKEKVIRIILATFRNILEKADDKEVVRGAAWQMVQRGTLKTLELMNAKKLDDLELKEDVDFLTAKLNHSVQAMSSFDEYVSEVKSGHLQWSPVHKSDAFWRENIERFNENNFSIVGDLIHLLSSHDPLTLCVAIHDIGEYVRHYPRGKIFVEENEGKSAVMRMLSAQDPNVRYHALLAIQKLMVQNWEYVGKRLDHGKRKPSIAAK